MGEFTIPAIHSIFFCQHGSFSLSVFLESPDPSNCWGMNCLQIILWVRAGVMNTIYVLWTQESQTMTLYNPPHHLSSQSVQWHPHRRLELKKDKTENLLSYFVSMSHSVFFSPILYYFSSTALCVSQHKPTNCISRYSSQTLGLVVYDQKPISAGSNEKKKKWGQSSRER